MCIDNWQATELPFRFGIIPFPPQNGRLKLEISAVQAEAKNSSIILVFSNHYESTVPNGPCSRDNYLQKVNFLGG